MSASRYFTPRECRLEDALRAMINEFGGKHPHQLDPGVEAHRILLAAIATLSNDAEFTTSK